MKLHTVDRSVNYLVADGKEDLFLCEMETNGNSMILKLIRVFLCVYLPIMTSRNFVFHENYYAVNFLYFLDVNNRYIFSYHRQIVQGSILHSLG